MKLIKHLGLGSNNASINTLVSPCGHGKTTLSCIIAGEYATDGENVLFITLDMSVKDVIKKLGETIDKSEIASRVILKSIPYENVESQLKNIIEFIYKSFKLKNYSVIVIDGGLSSNESFDMFRRVAIENNCTVITTQPLRRAIDSDQIRIVNSRVLQMSDVVFSVTKNLKLSFWSQVKYFFCFWKQKPNCNLTVLKSRCGNESSKNIFVDFKKAKITE